MRRTWSIFLTAALVSGALAALPAHAQTPVPAEPSIVDPIGDANYVNETMFSTPAGPVPVGRDHTDAPADAGSVSDLAAVWFTNTADMISVHFQTEAVPPATAAVNYQAFASPGEGEAGAEEGGCLRFLINIPGEAPTYAAEQWVRLIDQCNVGTSIFDDAVDGEAVIEEGPEGTGLTTITFPRSYSPLLADGQVLSAPWAASASPLVGEHTNAGFLTPYIDDTAIGTDYTISTGTAEPAPTASPSPPGEQEPPAKKKGCKKGTKKAKKACKKKQKKEKGPEAEPEPVGCAPYAPGDAGAEAETSVVTDANTAEAPIELEVETAEGLGAGRDPANFGMAVSHAYHNVQVDSAAAEAGLWASIEFTEVWDYDLYLDLADGTEVAHSAGFFAQGDGAAGTGDDEDSHTAPGSETITGVFSPDCQGYTLDIVGATTPGETITLKLWLGEVVYTPPSLAYEVATSIF